jgi:hypothetical protein
MAVGDPALWRRIQETITPYNYRNKAVDLSDPDIAAELNAAMGGAAAPPVDPTQAVPTPTTPPPTPYAPQGIDPAILERQKAGLQAQGDLQALMQGPEMARALRMANAQAPGVTGSGYSARGPTAMQGLAHFLTKIKGNEDLERMRGEAEALRGQTAEGKLAELEAQEAKRIQAQEFQLQQAREARESRAKEADLAFARRKELMDYEAAQREMQGGGEIGKLPVFAQKEVIASRQGVDAINRINNIANSLSAEEQAQLRTPGTDLVFKALTPSQAEEYQKIVRGFSPKVRQYLSMVQDFSADIRHQRFGSALTANEQALSQTFLPSAEGIFLEDRQQRMQDFQNKMYENVRGYDDFYGTQLGTRLPQMIVFESKKDQPEMVDGKPIQTNQTAFPDYNAMSMEELEAEYMKLTNPAEKINLRGL